MLYKTFKAIEKLMSNDPTCSPDDVSDFRGTFNLPLDLSDEPHTMYALSGLHSYNQPTDIPAVKELDYMFNCCNSFNQPIIIPYECEHLEFLLSGCESFNSEIFIQTDTLNCAYMLQYCLSMRSNIHCSLEQFKVLKLHEHCSKEYVYDVACKTAFIPSYGKKYVGAYIKYNNATDSYVKCDLSEFDVDMTDLF